MLGDLVLPRNPLTGKTATPRVTLREQDQTFYRAHVLDGKAIDGKSRRDLDAPKLRIAESIETVDRFLSGKSNDELKTFANFILISVFVVFVKTENRQSAFRLFNVLNDRGLGLTNADLIKAELFSHLAPGKDGEKALEHSWANLEDTTGIERLDRFLSYHRTAVRAEQARKSLSDEFADLIHAMALSPVEFVEELVKSARNYDAIASGKFEEPQAKRALAALNRVSYDEWVPALLAFLNKPVAAMNMGEYAGFLERITMQNWVRRLGRTKRNTIYYRLVTAINRGESAEEIRDIFRRSADNAEFLSLLQGDVYGLPSARAVLLRLEEGVQDLSVTKTYSGLVTIEHVMPQSLQDPYWTSRFTSEAHALWLHKLGNLTLLSGRKNTAAQSYAFPKKKEVYLKKNETVSFDLTKDVCNNADWTLGVIEARQERLLSIAARLWEIN